MKQKVTATACRALRPPTNEDEAIARGQRNQFRSKIVLYIRGRGDNLRAVYTIKLGSIAFVEENSMVTKVIVSDYLGCKQ